MAKKLTISTGSAKLLRDAEGFFDGYESVVISAGSALVSKKLYEKLLKMKVTFSCGNLKTLDIVGELIELPSDTRIGASMSFDGNYIFCDGKLVVESAAGLSGITGLYAEKVLHPESLDINSIKGMAAVKTSVYPDGARLRLSDVTLGTDAYLKFKENSLYYIDGTITALEGSPLEKLCKNNTSFKCQKLIIYEGLFEKYRGTGLFSSSGYQFIPDGHAVVKDIKLDAGTTAIYGDKLYVLKNFEADHGSIKYLKDFTSIIVSGTATMPVSAAADFRAAGRAGGYDLYEGFPLKVNGFQVIGHEQLQTALRGGFTYSLKVNGSVYSNSDVTPEDMEAIAEVTVNGFASVPDAARGVFDCKAKKLNGTVIDIDMMLKKLYGENFSYGDDPIGFIKEAIEKLQDVDESGEEGKNGNDVSVINSGSFKL